ncbi:uncharacterized protein LOC143908846 [Temnothorax americanus]|uniref:uncharacterized protein LOC143908846 n=1 Tax=Temnothorax americanus TaxID=1964332 RepID=UPI0040683E9B
MTKPCIVPKCKTGFKSLKIKRSVFKVPTHSERLKKWQAAIPSKKLTSSHYVCEKHFEEKYIFSESTSSMMRTGKLLQRLHINILVYTNQPFQPYSRTMSKLSSQYKSLTSSML